MESFAKTSGSKGLQLYAAPARGRHGTRCATKRTRSLASSSQSTEISSSPTCAGPCADNRVLIDWSQNHVAKTTVAAYSVRAMPDPSVSTPVTLDEVHRCAKKKDPAVLRFTTDEVLRRVDKHGDLFAPLAPA